MVTCELSCKAQILFSEHICTQDEFVFSTTYWGTQQAVFYGQTMKKKTQCDLQFWWLLVILSESKAW